MTHGCIANGRYEPAGTREVGADPPVPARDPACGTTRNRARLDR